MFNCSNCRHWTPPDERTDFHDAISFAYDGAPWEQRKEEVMAAEKSYGVCKVITIQMELPLGEPPPLAVTMDGSQYMATLYTQAEFGCYMWGA